MDANTLFLTATREKYRFSTSLGMLSIEDLWDLPLTSAKSANLNDVAKVLHRQLKEADVDLDFVNKPPVKKTDELQAKFEIVKLVIGTKVAERDSALAAKEKAERKKELLGILREKETAELKGKSPEEIRKLIDAL